MEPPDGDGRPHTNADEGGQGASDVLSYDRQRLVAEMTPEARASTWDAMADAPSNTSAGGAGAAARGGAAVRTL